MVTKIEAKGALQRVDSVVDVGVRGVEEDVDILTVAGYGEACQERSGALEDPLAGLPGAEQASECAVIGELALKFRERVTLIGASDLAETFFNAVRNAVGVV
ncbi:hypothetical protein Ahu01nite_088660 [Winogradskya humida]|uniref:Uncharacterized protein n=1 Tax=Winogradskya humida TaxID=113566 RepID=A0ABQ4A4W1_9ACTN|nr:hypothetical protein Ahu01nite_088660 [Actinoplanes humidus]